MNVINFYIYSQKNVVSVVFLFLVFDPSVEPSKKIYLVGEFWNFLEALAFLRRLPFIP